MALVLSTGHMAGMLAASPSLCHTLQAPAVRQDGFAGRQALQALLPRAFAGVESMHVKGQSVLRVVSALLAAADMVLSMAPSFSARQRSSAVHNAQGSGLLAVRMACVEGDVSLLVSLLASSWRRRHLQVALHDDPALHLARQQLACRHSPAGRWRFWPALDDGDQARGTGGGQGQDAYVSCLGLALMAAQPAVAAELIKAGADKGHGWGTGHGVTLVSAAQLLFLAAPPLGTARVCQEASVLPSPRPAPCLSGLFSAPSVQVLHPKERGSARAIWLLFSSLSLSLSLICGISLRQCLSCANVCVLARVNAVRMRRSGRR